MDTNCRTCSRTDEFQGISINAISECNQEPIYLMLIYCTQLQFSNNDTLPQQICPDCLLLLDASYTFWKQCRQSDANFRWGLTTGGSMLNPVDPIAATTPLPQVFRCCFQKCSKVASTLAELEEHAEQQHWQKRRGFQRRQTSEHKNICSVCCAGFKTQQSWEFHQMLLLGTREKSLACDRCRRVFPSNRELVSHRTKNCSEFAAEVLREESESDEWPDEEQEGFETEEAKVVERDLSESANERELMKLQKWEAEARSLPRGQLLGCGSCTYTTNKSYNMRRHQKIRGHEGIKRNEQLQRTADDANADRPEEDEVAPIDDSIQFVGIPVKVEPELQLEPEEEDEEEYTPPGRNKHECTHCGKVMSSRFNKLRHLKASCPVLHNRQFRYTCKYCKRVGTKTFKAMKRHMENNCLALKGEFPMKSSRVSHKQCTLCNKVFNTDKGLIRHSKFCTMCSKRNRKFRCEHCERVFHSKHNLRRHTESGICTNEVSCPDCDRTFRHDIGLQRHLKIGCQFDHKKESKSQCPHCLALLSKPSNLIRHFKTCYVLKQAQEQKQEVEGDEQQAEEEDIQDTSSEMAEPETVIDS